MSSFRVACPHAECGWTGSLVPSILRGGEDSEIVIGHRAWLQCPRCRCDWEVRIEGDKATILLLTKKGG